MSPDPTILRRRTQATAKTDRPLTEGRYRWARAYRDGELVCGRVELTVAADLRLGLAPHERRCFTARFLARLHLVLYSELSDTTPRCKTLALTLSGAILDATAPAGGHVP